jgi:amidase
MVAAAVRDAAALLGSLGHEVEEVAAPQDDAALARDFLTIWFAQAAATVADARRRTGSGDEGFELDTLIMAAQR